MFGRKPAPYFVRGDVVDAETWIEKCELVQWCYDPSNNSIELVGVTKTGERLVFMALEQQAALEREKFTGLFSFLGGVFGTAVAFYYGLDLGMSAKSCLGLTALALVAIPIIFTSESIVSKIRSTATFKGSK